MSAVRKYRKRPTVIEAMQWTGDNWREVQKWCGDHAIMTRHGGVRLFVNANSAWLDLEPGEWIARDRHGFYPIKDDVFRESYEFAGEPTAAELFAADKSLRSE